MLTITTRPEIARRSVSYKFRGTIAVIGIADEQGVSGARLWAIHSGSRVEIPQKVCMADETGKLTQQRLLVFIFTLIHDAVLLDVRPGLALG